MLPSKVCLNGHCGLQYSDLTVSCRTVAHNYAYYCFHALRSLHLGIALLIYIYPQVKGHQSRKCDPVDMFIFFQKTHLLQMEWKRKVHPSAETQHYS